MKRCVEETYALEWMTQGKTPLSPIQNDPPKNRSQQLQTHNVPTHDMENTNRINWWEYFLFANKPRTVPRKQKGTRKGTRDLLYIDQQILKDCKTKRKILATTLIDYKSSYNMVLQSCIIECIKKYKIFDEVIKFIEETMKNWRVKLIVRKDLSEENIHRGIFRIDALSPLLFVIAMMPLNHIRIKSTGG